MRARARDGGFGLGKLAATGLVTFDLSGNAETAFGQAELRFPFNWERELHKACVFANRLGPLVQFVGITSR